MEPDSEAEQDMFSSNSCTIEGLLRCKAEMLFKLASLTMELLLELELEGMVDTLTEGARLPLPEEAAWPCNAPSEILLLILLGWPLWEAPVVAAACCWIEPPVSWLRDLCIILERLCDASMGLEVFMEDTGGVAALKLVPVWWELLRELLALDPAMKGSGATLSSSELEDSLEDSRLVFKSCLLDRVLWWLQKSWETFIISRRRISCKSYCSYKGDPWPYLNTEKGTQSGRIPYGWGFWCNVLT